MIALRPYQQEAIAAVHEAAARGVNRQLISLPTGTGKTLVFASLARELNGRTLILAHRDELIQQAVDKLQLVWPGVDVGIVKAERNELGRQVTVASVQSLARPHRLEALGQYDLIVTDEAHHAIAVSYRRIYEHLGDVLHVGVTATPQRGDKAGLSAVFDEVVYSKTLLEMVQAGYLADLRGLRLCTDIDLSGVRTVAGDFVERDLAAAVNVPERNEEIVAAMLAYGADRRTLVFACDVQHASDLAETFRDSGVKTAAVSGETPLAERRALLEAFGKGHLDVLCNCQLLTEGFDQPAVSCVVVARPTQSQACYVQMVGRGTRLYPGKVNCLVVDVADNTRRHQLVQLPNLVGLEYEAREDGMLSKSVLELVAEDKQRRHALGQVAVEDVDLFGGSRFSWLVAGDAFYLPVPGYGQIRLAPGDGGFRVSFLADAQHGGGCRWLTDRPLDLGWAQGVAEDEARRLLGGRTTIIQRDAPWRSQPASDKQRQTLRRFGVKIRRGITRGEASDLIGQRHRTEAVRLRALSAFFCA